MFVTLVAILCHSLDGTPLCRGDRHQLRDGRRLNWMSCQVHAQPGIAEWLKANPKYQGWTLQRWKCVPGHYDVGRRA